VARSPARRVLIPADAPERGEVERVLRNEGWMPLPYTDAAEAETVLSSGPATAVILQRAGEPMVAELIKRVRRICPEAFLLGIGGSVGADGPDAILRQPCTPTEVAVAVRLSATLRNARTAEQALRRELRSLEQQAKAQAQRIAELETACSNLKAWAESAQALALRDELTGLYNRRHFLQAAEQEIERARREKLRFAIAMVDIDHFKQHNDTYGHLAGDELLKQLAGNLKQNLRRMDTVARYGGEEFIMLLPETRESAKKGFDPLRLVERLRMSIEKHSFHNHAHLTVSGGVAQYPNDGSEVTDLIAAVDARLYRAKSTGRNRICASDES